MRDSGIHANGRQHGKTKEDGRYDEHMPKLWNEMKKEKQEMDKGTFVDVEVCPKCKDEWVDSKDYKAVYRFFRRRTFKIGGSLAVRIPKEIVDKLDLKEGTPVEFDVQDNKIVMEAKA